MLTKQELDNIRAAVAGGAIKDELTAKLLDHIAELEENATAQALALKEANERADANERDTGRYRWLRKRHWSDSTLAVVAVPKRSVKLGEDCPSEERLDAAIDQAMRNL